MNIETKKLDFIEWLTKLNDTTIINRLDLFRKKVSKSNQKAPTLTFDELLADLETSEKQRKQGKVISIEDLEKESESW